MGTTDQRPPSRSESQRHTREALVYAAREVFGRDGYHGARLDEIARVAGFSKGAVYSNFEGKAGLFLAMVDANTEAALTEAWDPFDRIQDRPEPGSAEAQEEAELAESMRGVALATLEFIATAGRDEALMAQLSSRMQVLVDLYVTVAARSAPDDDALSPAEVGTLMAALDQGVALLVLSGLASVDQGLLRAGMRRLVDPRRAAEGIDEVAGEGPDGRGASALHDQVLQRRIATSIAQP